MSAYTIFYYTKLFTETKITRRFLETVVLPRLEALGLHEAKAELQRLTKPPELPGF